MINRLKHRMKQDEGFTLIELLIVIVVLGILAAIVVFALSNQTGNSVTAACKADAKAVEIAQEAYRADKGTPGVYTFAPDVATLVNTGGTPTYLRTAPATTHYQIVTNNTGQVWVFPGAPAAITPLDNAHNFDLTSTVCSTMPT